MSTDLAVVGLSIVPPVALMGVAFGRHLRNVAKKVQVNVLIQCIVWPRSIYGKRAPIPSFDMRCKS